MLLGVQNRVLSRPYLTITLAHFIFGWAWLQLAS